MLNVRNVLGVNIEQRIPWYMFDEFVVTILECFEKLRHVVGVTLVGYKFEFKPPGS